MKLNKLYKKNLEEIYDSFPSFGLLGGKTILITGANGLIGSAIIDFLLYLNAHITKKIHIIASSRNILKLQQRFKNITDKYLTLLEYDVTQKLTYSDGIDYIIHAASNAHPVAFSSWPVETMLANFMGTYQLLDYARLHKVGRMLFVSSSEVYGQIQSGEPFKESDYGFVDILNPRACYPASKRAAETLCASYLSEYSIDTVIVRPGHIYGPTMTAEDSRAHAQFARNALRQEPIILKSLGNQLRSYCYMLDCVSGIFTALLKGKTGEAYNISNKNSIVTIKQFAQEHAAVGKVEIRNCVPEKHEASGYNLMENSALDATKLESLGWKGLYDIHSGVSATIQLLREGLYT